MSCQQAEIPEKSKWGADGQCKSEQTGHIEPPQAFFVSDAERYSMSP